jgi:hypothetical protein
MASFYRMHDCHQNVHAGLNPEGFVLMFRPGTSSKKFEAWVLKVHVQIFNLQ